jgi:pimeloyl-ACP methyl ester carboxylesterase
MKMGRFAVAFAAALMLSSTGFAASPKIVSASEHIPSGTPGIELYVREKHPAGIMHFAPDRILLFVHGATYPAETSFDLPLDGVSMMDWLAARGFDVWLVDIRGYGLSTRPPEMDQPPEANPPLVDTATVAHDVGMAVDHILAKRHVPKLDVMGWSWGTSIMGLYTSTHDDKVDRLVLYAPQWLVNPLPPAPTDTLGAYRLVTRDAAKQRWLNGVAPDQQAALIPPGWFDQWADATFATDPAGAKLNPPVLRATNGVTQDSRTYWRAGKPLYDPAKITVPVLVIHAEWDADLPSYQAQGYFAALTQTPWKRFVEIGQGTHTVMMEKNRMQLFDGVADFLEEKDPLKK